MNDKELLLQLIKEYIDHINHDFKINIPPNFDDESYSYLKNKVDDIINNSNELISFKLGKIKELFPSFDDLEYETLEFYQLIMYNVNFKMSEYDYEVLKSIIGKLQHELDGYAEIINKYKQEEEQKKQMVIKYQTLIDKINTDFDLKSSDVELIYDIIKKSTLKITDSIRLMRYITNEIFKSHTDIEEEEEEIEIIETTNLTYATLKSFFMKYNIDFDAFNYEEQDELQEYGNLDNIEKILDALSGYGVDVSEYMDTRSSALTNIFLYSNADLVINLIENFKKYGILKNEDGKMDISLLLERPSRFLKRKKKWARRKQNGKIIDKIDSVSGCQEDVIKNLEYFSNEGLDVANAYEKSGYYFDLPHDQILEVVKTFELYSIDKKYYLKTLSCFNSKHQADSIDMFIELGYLDYVKNNMSRLLQTPNSPIFYKLARAKQLGKVPQYYRGGLEGNVTSDSKEYLGIKGKNGKEVTKQYVFEFDGRKYFDEVLSTKTNNRTNIVLQTQKDLIYLLDKNFMEIENNGYPNYRLYNIDGILISRTKFLRIYNTLITSGITPSLNCVLYSLTKNSIITKEQFDIVYNRVSSLYNELQDKRGGRRK